MRRSQYYQPQSVLANKVAMVQDYDKRGQVDISTHANTVCAGETFENHNATGKAVDINGSHD